MGGLGGTVDVTLDGSVITTGEQSGGVLVQSVGGGGGNGGMAIGAAVAGAGGGAGTITIGLGGEAGNGGIGGNVDGTVGSDVSTSGDGSSGVIIQSIGGGGGNSGLTVSAGAAGAGVGAGGISVAIGASGGLGGDGGLVDGFYSGDLVTTGNHATGLLIQSVGGGGGNSGGTIAASLNGAGTGAGSISLGIGGAGGGAGNGGNSTSVTDVTATTSGSVMTSGDYSSGIVIQSVGGGGGNGGYDVSASLAAGGTGAGAVSVGLGGNAGGGGNGESVVATLGSDITTSGNDSAGAVVQSVGGGGGNGGFNVSGGITGGGVGSGGVTVGLGGSGGAGGTGGNVTAISNGTIMTGGSDSAGYLVQSVGGGGGNGGFDVSAVGSFAGEGSGAIAVGIGGSGGPGQNSGTVNASQTGNVTTGGDNSGGVIAQSLGGGGGNGGLNVSAVISGAGTGSGAISVGIGGSGGTGGFSSDVINYVNGNVATDGASSAGVLAQSIGGGGGSGGIDVTGSISLAGDGSGAIGVGLGGSGSGGGNSADVTNTVIGSVTTQGNDSSGIVAESLGGGGGNGGINVTGAIDLSQEAGGSIGVGIGGFGGGAGSAGSVDSYVTASGVDGLVFTDGNNADAIVAQSLGGGGGNGALNVTGAISVSGKSGGALGVGIGGFGGGGGNSSDVTLGVMVGEAVATNGKNSNGLVAQSIAGGGGNGGINVTGSLAFSPGGGGGTTAVASLGLGGFGGAGGNAGTINVNFDGPQIDAMKGSGIVAQSIGGGGGNGGTDVSAGISYTGGTDSGGYGMVVGVGGYGGSGGTASTVNVNVTASSIEAGGVGQSSILAQSIGGGGGNGGLNVSGGIVSSSPLLVGVGGLGANAGSAGDVSVDNSASVYTTGDLTETSKTSAGILAQSIGGGGGNGGLDVTGGLSISKSMAPSVTVGIGGDGGAGAASGNVIVSMQGDATSYGDSVDGIVAQSIAGGGGNGGMNVSGEVNFANSDSSGGNTDLSIVAGIGGTGGTASNAGTVNISDSGLVSTTGDYADGVLAQSIGGGGGTGGLNVTGVFAKNSSPITVGVGGSGGGGGDANTVTVTRGTVSTSAGVIETDGTSSNGLEASSLAGGGGDAGMNFILGFSQAGSNGGQSGFSAQFAIGGSGSDAGTAGNVIVNNYSGIVTLGDDSDGILAQSIGGGGGNASLNLAATYENSNEKNMGFNLAVGGGTGDGGIGGNVNVTNVGDISTSGTASFGIVAESIGGGGGNAELSLALFKGNGGQASISLGAEGGTGGAAGDVNLSSNGNVTTVGDGSYGLLAQSLGNGGGNSSSNSISVTGATEPDAPTDSAKLAVGLEGGTGGTAGDVTLTAAGFVGTQGTNADAIIAQSIGGGGGNGGSASTQGFSPPTVAVSIGGTGGTGGTGGVILIDSSANVQTLGNGSIAILAQSIGGGGGTGGMARTGSLKPSSMAADSLTAVVGGTGGTGMTGGLVTVNTSGVIETEGTEADGILAQSVGGGGGESGMAITTEAGSTTESSGSIALTLGGAGGTGATASDVHVTNTGVGANTGDIETFGDHSNGIFAQSIGGGGGKAASVFNGAYSTGGGAANLTVLLGGNGGTGGSAGAVMVSNLKSDNNPSGESGVIYTEGLASNGILAMSVGGGGGSGSTTINTSVATAAAASSETQSLTFNMGGSGGSGGSGGLVNVQNQGTIETRGSNANAITALSIGGGGGIGGTAISGNFALGAPSQSQTAVSIALGGSGGSGNTSGNVVVNNSGTIETTGTNSDGIFAESVGGGGGNGGFAVSLSNNVFGNPVSVETSLSNIALGGSGGSGADSGNVSVTNSGSIIISGANSYGIYAQAVSGGGGNAGYSISAPAAMAVADGIYSTLLGGGSTGVAGTVTINSTGDISVSGQGSMAEFQQSVNGGGGNVNLYLDYSKQEVDLDPDGNALPGNGGVVQKLTATVENYLTLGGNAVSGLVTPMATSLAAPHAFFAAPQLLIAPSGAAGGDLSGTSSDNLSTAGFQSEGSLTQTIGGGGGNAVSNVVVDTAGQVEQAVVLGETSTSTSPEGNNGGTINLTRNGNVVTLDDESPGAGIQSIGGGGGNVSANVTVVADGTSPSSSTPLVNTATLGANGGLGNGGGAITLHDTGNVTTRGARSYGLLVQSIGAGGGAGVLTGLENLQVTMGGQGGASGDAGDISLTNTGVVTTMGTLSDGIVLQSIGGGGGIVLTDLTANNETVTSSAANSGSGGNVSLSQTGDINVYGVNSIGVLAQSLGGGGGAVDRVFADSAGGAGMAGTIDLTFDGNVVADGTDGVGLFAQSRGADGEGDINILLTAHHEIYSGTGGVGVEMLGGADNSFTNYGIVDQTDGVQGTAVLGDTGNNTVNNYDLMVGSVDLGSGLNAFNHEAGAVFLTGAEINLGPTGTFYNAGTIAPGDVGTLQTTALTGNFVQNGDAIWYDDITPTFASDELTISGTADLGAYTNVVNLNQLVAVPSTTGAYTLITAASGLTGSFQFGSLTGFTMPIGLTYTLSNSSTQERLLLNPSTGPFYFSGSVDSVWNTDFVNGQSNFTSDIAGSDYIYGTPGVASDVYFETLAAASSNTYVTELGADFTINSLTVGNFAPLVVDSPNNSLTIAAAGGDGITLKSNAPTTTLDVNLVLAGNQSWTNNSASLLNIYGPTVTSPGNYNLTVAGPGETQFFSQLATGSGSLTKDGTGLLILYNTSNLYSGGTNIDGGRLAVDSSGALGLGNVVNAATLETTESLGGSVRTIHVAENYTQTSAGTLLLEVVSTPTASPSTPLFSTGVAGVNYENLAVADAAVLGGTLDLNFGSNTVVRPGQRYTAVTAGAPLTGQFNIQTTTNLPTPYFTITTENDTFGDTQPANSAVVTLMQPFTSFSHLNPNQTSVAGAVDTDLTNLNNGGFFVMPVGQAADFFNNIVTGINVSLTQPGQLGLALDQLSPQRLQVLRGIAFDNAAFASQNLNDHLANLRDGQTGLDLSGFSYSDSDLGTSMSQIKGHLLACNAAPNSGVLSDSGDPVLGGASPSNASSQRWSAFISGNVVLGDFNSNADTSHSSYTSGGATLGADYRVDKNWTIGALFSYNHTDVTLDNEGSRATIDSYSPGLYAAYSQGGWYANGLIDYSYNGYTENREINFPTINRSAVGSPQGDQFAGDLTGGYDFHLGQWIMGPSAGLNYVHFKMNDFSEQGAGAAGLNIQQQQDHSLRSLLGFNMRWNTKYMNTAFTYHLTAQWQHEMLDNSDGITSSLEVPDTAQFTVQSPKASRDSALLDFGTDVQVNRSTYVFVDYQAQAGQSNYFGQSVQAGVKIGF